MNRTKILDRFLDPVGSCLTPEVAKRLVKIRLDAKTQRRLDAYAERNQAGELTDEELEEYDTYIAAIDFVSILQAKARALLKRRVKS